MDADRYEECTERHVKRGTIFKVAPDCGVRVESHSDKIHSKGPVGVVVCQSALYVVRFRVELRSEVRDPCVFNSTRVSFRLATGGFP